MAPPAKCLYETLVIPMTATEVEIKKAYRIQALVHHPDKNPNRQEQAEEAFKAIQHAYDVLSDTHERAWYDAHRDQILRGKDPVSGEEQTAKATDVDLFSYFSTSAWNGFEGEGGFYYVFCTVFEQLWKEETAATEKDKIRPVPKFGNASSKWEDVRAFYQEWEPFSSVKSFAFADKWNLADAPNREYRRAMEKENKRNRTKCRKEFNNGVRELVMFVKKRDPRVMLRRKQEEKEREQTEIVRKQKEQIRKEERRDEAQKVKEAREAALEEDADALDVILAGIALDERIERQNERRRTKGTDEEANSETQEQSDELNAGNEEEYNTSEDELVEDLYCVACKKSFRTSAQKTDHERSKKHKSAMTKMKKKALQEEEDFTEFDIDVGTGGNLEEVDIPITKSRKKRKQKARVHKTDFSEEEEELEEVRMEKESEEEWEEVGIEKESEETAANEVSSELRGVNGTKDKAGEKEKVLSKKEKRKLREEKKKSAKVVHKCNVCNNQFSSRTKLMKHVNNMGHALHVGPQR